MSSKTLTVSEVGKCAHWLSKNTVNTTSEANVNIILIFYHRKDFSQPGTFLNLLSLTEAAALCNQTIVVVHFKAWETPPYPNKMTQQCLIKLNCIERYNLYYNVSLPK